MTHTQEVALHWTKRFVTSGQVTLAARDSGGAGPTAILIHGLGATQRHWDRVARLLRPRFRVITYDQRGHGRSTSCSDYRLGDFTTDLLSVVTALEAERPVLVGHSMGALTAVEAAVRRECGAVVTVDGGFFFERPAAARDRQRYEAELRRPLNRLLLRLSAATGAGASLSSAQLWELTEAVISREQAVEDAYRQLTCPVLQVLAGRPDPVPWGQEAQAAAARAAEVFQRAHPTVTQVRLDSDHVIPLRRPKELADHIARFVADPRELPVRPADTDQ